MRKVLAVLLYPLLLVGVAVISVGAAFLWIWTAVAGKKMSEV